jgi:hypothetical protein
MIDEFKNEIQNPESIEALQSAGDFNVQYPVGDKR